MKLDLETTIRRFIAQEIMGEKHESAVKIDDPLLENGILDSIGILELVAFLETELGIEVSDNEMVPENASYYRHTMEGPDDMPAHIKAVLLGSSVVIPVTEGQFNFGTWQGIFLCEHRDRGSARRLVVTLSGDSSGS